LPIRPSTIEEYVDVSAEELRGEDWRRDGDPRLGIDPYVIGAFEDDEQVEFLNEGDPADAPVTSSTLFNL
jgi:hypothetical protein